MKPNTEKKVKPLKKIKALEKKNEIDALMVKPAVRIQELKNKLIILGHDLKVNKKINDSLYRKIQLLTYSRTTEQKLKDSYKTLKDIDNKINNKTDSTEKTKKITVKDFKENKRLLMMTKMYCIIYILNIKFGLSLMDHLKRIIINCL